MNRVLKLFRPNGKLSQFNNLSLKIVYGFVATLRKRLDNENKEKLNKHKRSKLLETSHTKIRLNLKQS